jgi:hypothetical protein
LLSFWNLWGIWRDKLIAYCIDLSVRLLVLSHLILIGLLHWLLTYYWLCLRGASNKFSSKWVCSLVGLMQGCLLFMRQWISALELLDLFLNIWKFLSLLNRKKGWCKWRKWRLISNRSLLLLLKWLCLRERVNSILNRLSLIIYIIWIICRLFHLFFYHRWFNGCLPLNELGSVRLQVWIYLLIYNYLSHRLFWGGFLIVRSISERLWWLTGIKSIFWI